MNDFNKTVIIIATIILVTALLFLAITLSKSMFEESFPPIRSECPDYWDMIRDSEGNINCVNNSNVNTGSYAAEIKSECESYPASQFSGTDLNEIKCNKYKWANKCGITWDSITNSNDACK